MYMEKVQQKSLETIAEDECKMNKYVLNDEAGKFIIDRLMKYGNRQPSESGALDNVCER